MTYLEYESARTLTENIGSPVATYIFIISLALAAISIYIIASGIKQTSINPKIQSLHDSLLLLDVSLILFGFLLLVWFHLRIYQTIEIQFPAYLTEYLRTTQGISVDTLRFAIPLWIEAEKLYFWMVCFSVFIYILHRKRRGVQKNTHETTTDDENITSQADNTNIYTTFVPSLNLLLATLAYIMYIHSNPFKNPLPIVHSEITAWHNVQVISNPQIVAEVLMKLYGRITYYYNTEYMWTHPLMLFISYAAFAVSFVACIFMLLKRHETYQKIAYNHAKIGYLLLTVGMLLGYPWAILAWGDDPWWWDPKINGSIMMWVLYSAFLHSRIYVNRYWKTTAVIGILCFISLVFTYLLTYIVPGIHSISQA